MQRTPYFQLNASWGVSSTIRKCKRTISRVPYKVTKAPNGDVRVILDGKEYSPPEISAMILAKLQGGFGSLPGRTGDAGGDHRASLFQRCPAQCTKDAGKIAGLEVLRIITSRLLLPWLTAGQEKE